MEDSSSVTGQQTAQPAPEIVRYQLQRILSSQRFRGSEALRDFLRCIVEYALDGNSDQLKESVIAIEAFHRRPSFDPRLDAVVRVQAVRLRAALAEYYATEGRTDELIIDVPKGGYAPVFTQRPGSELQPPAESGRFTEEDSLLNPETGISAQAGSATKTLLSRGIRHWLTGTIAAAIVVAVLLVAFGAWRHWLRLARIGSAQTIVIADFENATGDPVFDGTIRQALLMDLDQSPELNILADQQQLEIRNMMGRPASEALRGDVALELCRRAGARALISGSIANMGRLYVLGLTVEDCANGDRLFADQVRADGKEKVLAAVDQAAAHLRSRLGESLANRKKYSQPLEAVTTPSLKALQAYSEGVEVRYSKGDKDSIPFFLRAIELDPNFAMAYAQLALDYFDLTQNDLMASSLSKAYSLRRQVSQHERYFIEAHYNQHVAIDDDNALVIYEDWGREFPRDPGPSLGAALIHMTFGDYERAAVEYRNAIRINPSRAYYYTNLGQTLLCLDRLKEVHATLDELHSRKMSDIDEIMLGYQLAYLEGDSAGMQQEIAASANRSEAEDILLVYQAFSQASQGRLPEARALFHQAIALAISLKAPDRAAAWQIQSALIEAEMSNRKDALQQVEATLKLSSDKEVRTLAALAWARAGESRRAQDMADELKRQFPEDTILNRYWLPSIAAAIDLNLHQPEKAIEELIVTLPYQAGQPSNFLILSIAPNYPAYLRGLAYQMADKPAEAAAQFRLLTNAPGCLVNYPLRSLAMKVLSNAASASALTAVR